MIWAGMVSSNTVTAAGLLDDPPDHRFLHCLAMRYTERLKGTGVELSVVSLGDSCYNPDLRG
jgi:hypothetical protein